MGQMPEKNKDQRYKESPLWAPPGPPGPHEPLDPVQHSNLLPIPSFLLKPVQADLCC